MAAKILTPSCEVSGLPLPIYPQELGDARAFSIPRSHDRHHHFHPANELSTGSASVALRRSRMQKVQYGVHHYGYHEIFEGPSLPKGDSEAFEQIVPSVAGVVPRKALYIPSPDTYFVVDLDDKDHMAVSRSISIERQGQIGRFIAEYASKQNVRDVIDDVVIEEFIDKKTHHARKMELASFILGHALDISVEPLESKREEFVQEGLFNTERVNTFRKVAKNLVRKHRNLDFFRLQMYDRFAYEDV